MRHLLGAPLAAALATLFAATAAHAKDPFTLDKIQAGGGLNYGFYVGGEEGIPNAYGPGFNLRGGYTLGPGVYVGAELNYFLGGSQNQSVDTGLGILEAEITWRVLQYGAEVGYDFALTDQLVLRPKLGIGYGSVEIEAATSLLTLSDSYGGVVIPIGIQGLYSLGKVFLGAEARYGLLTVDVEDPVTGQIVKTNANAIIIAADVGVRF